MTNPPAPPKGHFRPPKLSFEIACEVRRLHIEEGLSANALALRYGVSRHSIQAILRGRAYQDPALKAHATAAVANDDAWRATVAQARNRRKGTFQITIEKYNELWAAYQDQQDASHLATTCVVSPATARRYIEKGDPARNLRPLRDRLARTMALVQQREEYTLAQARADHLRIARAIQGRLVQRVNTADPDKIPEALMAKFLKDLQGIVERTFGQADLTVEHRGDRFARYTVEELQAFLAAGEIPPHDMTPTGNNGKGE